MRISLPRDSPPADASIGISEPRAYLVETLDSIRRQEQAVALNKARHLLLADRHGMKPAEIADAVGMSESGVRSAIARAKASPGEADGVTP